MPVITKPFEPAPAFFAVPGFMLIVGSLLNPYAYARGLNNQDKPLFLVAAVLAVAGVALVIGAMIWVMATWGRSSKLSKWFGVVCVALPLIAGILLLVLPIRPYERGVAVWARQIDAGAIRAWYAAPPAPATAAAAATTIPGYGGMGPGWRGYAPDPLPVGAIEYDGGTFSSEILILSPRRVWRIPADAGVYLEWGDPGYSMVNSRRLVFIGADVKGGPPTAKVASHDRWQRAAPGVWVLIE